MRRSAGPLSSWYSLVASCDVGAAGDRTPRLRPPGAPDRGCEQFGKAAQGRYSRPARARAGNVNSATSQNRCMSAQRPKNSSPALSAVP